MPDLDRQLRAYFDALADDVVQRVGADGHLRSSASAYRRPGRRRSVLAVAALVAAVVIAIVAVRVSDTRHDGRRPRVTVVGPTPSVSTTVVVTPAVVSGTWKTLLSTTAPGEEFDPYAVALDADRVLVLFLENGGNDVGGEIIHLATWRATPIAASPLQWRAFALVGWTGSEVVVAGGSNGPGIDVVGAAYNPAANSWRRISAPPGFVPGRSENQIVGPGVWTGTELLSWQSRLAYDPAHDSWRTIAAAPLAPRTDETVVATPQGVLVWGGCDSTQVPNCDDSRTGAFADGALYDPNTNTWRMVPAGPLRGGVGALSVWAPPRGEVIIVVPDPADPNGSSVAAFDPETERWRTLADLPRDAGTAGGALVWTGTHAVVWGGYAHGISSPETERGFALDPDARRWSALTPGGGARRGHTAIWTAHGLLVVGGGPTAAAALFAPATDALGAVESP
jgi:hypothetical protein